MRPEDFAFHLPQDRIAQTAKPRGSSRLFVVDRQTQTFAHLRFNALPDLLQPSDCLVVNDSKVIPARLWAKKTATQARIELLLHEKVSERVWTALARPSKRLQPGTELAIGPETLRVRAVGDRGQVELEFASSEQAETIIEQFGQTPLPPYIRRPERSRPQELQDRKRYQTVYARQPGSVAAPTAGLHFSPASLKHLQVRGVEVAPLTLHVGWGTFAPLGEGELDQLKLPAERFNLPRETAERIERCRARSGRVIACGTTVARTLESQATGIGRVRPGSGTSDLFIRPGHAWQVVQGLLTNFHLPSSSLFILACAFGGTDLVQRAYHEAIKKKYRFYSYGDAMLLI